MFTFAINLPKGLEMTTIEEIRKPVSGELALFDKTFKEALVTNNPLLSGVNEYILQKSGKKLRPILVLLSSRLIGEVNMSTIYGAIAIELLHTASLVHDDVVDDTTVRRGIPSVNAKWTNKIAILSGDYMLSNSLYQVSRSGSIEILRALSMIGMQLSDGELLQLNSTQQTNTDEEAYFNIIKNKTAYLFAACTEVGAVSVNASKEQAEKVRSFGEYLGFCFQIKDDIFDYHTDIEIGKPTGNDLRDGKITLPLIHALRNASKEKREEVLKIISNKDFTDENIASITAFAIESGGLDYAAEKMEEFKQKAIDMLDGFEDSEYKNSLIQCVEFAVNRKH